MDIRSELWGLVALIGLFMACSIGSSKETSASAVPYDELTQQETPREGFRRFALDMDGLSADMLVPDKARRGVTPTHSLEDVSQIHRLDIGKGFSLQFREEDRQVGELLDDWMKDPVWQTEVVEQGTEHVVVLRSLPGGAVAHHHVAVRLETTQGNWLFFSDPMQEFSLQEVEDMLYSAQSFQWSEEVQQPDLSASTQAVPQPMN